MRVLPLSWHGVLLSDVKMQISITGMLLFQGSVLIAAATVRANSTCKQRGGSLQSHNGFLCTVPDLEDCCRGFVRVRKTIKNDKAFVVLCCAVLCCAVRARECVRARARNTVEDRLSRVRNETALALYDVIYNYLIIYRACDCIAPRILVSSAIGKPKPQHHQHRRQQKTRGNGDDDESDCD